MHEEYLGDGVYVALPEDPALIKAGWLVVRGADGRVSVKADLLGTLRDYAIRRGLLRPVFNDE